MSKKIKRAPATAVLYPDGRIRGLALSDEHWRWLQFKLGERVIIEFVTEDDEADSARGYDGDYDIASGEVVLDGGEKLVRSHGLDTSYVDSSDMRHRMFVRRPHR